MHLAMDDEGGVSKMCVFVDLRSVGGHCLDKTALGTMLELMQVSQSSHATLSPSLSISLSFFNQECVERSAEMMIK